MRHAGEVHRPGWPVRTSADPDRRAEERLGDDHGVTVRVLRAGRRLLRHDEGLAAVADHELDVALVYEFPSTPVAAVVAAADVDTIPLLADPPHVMLARTHPLAGRRRPRLTDLAGEHWIQGARNGSTSTVLPFACRAAGFEPDILFRTDDQVTVQGLVATLCRVGAELGDSVADRPDNGT